MKMKKEKKKKRHAHLELSTVPIFYPEKETPETFFSLQEYTLLKSHWVQEVAKPDLTFSARKK